MLHQPQSDEPAGVMVSDALRVSAERAVGAQERLALVGRARQLPEGISPDNLPSELRRLVTIDWVGPIEQAAERLAREAGYDYTRLGTPPASPIIVDLVATSRPLFEIVQSAGLQARGRAELAVNPSAKRIEVRYAR